MHFLGELTEMFLILQIPVSRSANILVNILGINVFMSPFFMRGFFNFFDYQVFHFARFSIYSRFFFLTQIHRPLDTLSLPRVFKKSSGEYMAAAMCLHPPSRPPLHLHLA